MLQGHFPTLLDEARFSQFHKVLLTIFALLALWRVFVVIRIHFNRPKHLSLKYRSFALGKCLNSLDFIFRAPTLIHQAYRDLGKVTFAIPALTEYQVLACSDADIKEVCERTEQTLSFHAAMTDRLKHKYTMYGFEHNDVDPHNSVPARTIKVLLRTHLPMLQPVIESRVEQGFEEVVGQNLPTTEWTSVSAFGLAKSITERVNSQVFLGSELANDANFMAHAARYSTHAVVAMEICRQLPSILAPIVATTIMWWSGAMHKVADSIRKVVIKRLDAGGTESQMDCIQWTIESSHTEAQRNLERLVQQIVAIFFATSHQMPMALVYAVYSLCTHPEYLEPLRQEATELLNHDAKDPFRHMHLLDGFLRESARLNPLDALSVQRKVLVPLRLPSGAFVPAGNLIAVPQHAVLRDESLYPDAESFNPYRYVPNQEYSRHKDAKTKYTDVSLSYPYWGSPKKPCPGRWYVSHTLKQALVHLYMNYDFKLADEKASRMFFWTTAMVPRMGTQLLMKRRDDVRRGGTYYRLNAENSTPRAPGSVVAETMDMTFNT